MDSIIRLFDLFNETAKKLAGYMPQSGSDLLILLKKLMDLAMGLNDWIINNIGVNLKLILVAMGRVVVLWLTFLFELLRALAERI